MIFFPFRYFWHPVYIFLSRNGWYCFSDACLFDFVWAISLTSATLSIYVIVPFSFHGISSLYKPRFSKEKKSLRLTAYSRITTIYVTTKRLSVALYMNILTANNLLVTNNIKIILHDRLQMRHCNRTHCDKAASDESCCDCSR